MTAVSSRAAPAAVILICGCLIAILTFGPRSTMGFFLTPMTTANGWSREAFAFAIAVQNLLWGLGQPLAGMVADRFGTWRVLTGGAALYALGLVLMAFTSDGATLALTAGVVLGLGDCRIGLLPRLSAFARLLPEALRPTAMARHRRRLRRPAAVRPDRTRRHRCLRLPERAARHGHPDGAGAAAGDPARWSARAQPGLSGRDQSIREAWPRRSATAHTSCSSPGSSSAAFTWRFITVHLPPYVVDAGLDPAWGAFALAMIGGFNIVGSLAAGQLSGRWSKRLLLSGIYAARAVAYGLFWLLPVTPASVVLFAAAAGLLWLSTVRRPRGWWR